MEYICIFLQSEACIYKILYMLSSLLEQSSYETHLIYPHAVRSVRSILAESSRRQRVAGARASTPADTDPRYISRPEANIGDYTNDWTKGRLM